MMQTSNPPVTRGKLLLIISAVLSSCIGDVPQVWPTAGFVLNHTEDSIYVESSIYDYEENENRLFSGWCAPNDSVCVFDGVTYMYMLDEYMEYMRVYNTHHELLYEDADRHGEEETWVYEDTSNQSLVGYFHFYGK